MYLINIGVLHNTWNNVTVRHKVTTTQQIPRDRIERDLMKQEKPAQVDSDQGPVLFLQGNQSVKDIEEGILNKIDQLRDRYYDVQKLKSKIHTFDYEVLTEPRNENADNTLMVITVFCLRMDYVRRQTIRQTWGSLSFQSEDENMKRLLSRTQLLFLVARDVEKEYDLMPEQNRYGDILEYNFTDSYQHLTLKSLAALHYVHERYNKVLYWLKVDSDTFVNLPTLIKVLEVTIQRDLHRVIIGHITNKYAAVYRHGKWAVDVKTFPLSFYPIYVNGPCYLVTSDVIPDLIEQADKLEWIPTEDAFITGILAKIVGVNHMNFPGRMLTREKETEAEAVCLHGTGYATGLWMEEQFYKFWNQIQTGKC